MPTAPYSVALRIFEMIVRTAKDKPKRQDDFESVARRLGCDEDKERFEKKLGKIANANKRTPAAGRQE